MTTALAKKPLRQVSSVVELLKNDQARDQLQQVAARHMNPQRMMRVTANAIRTTPQLQECEPMSFLGALMQCASLGLEPNTVLGHAYLIPFNNSRKIDNRWVKIKEVQLIVGYKGLIDLARRSGHITAISASIHYSDDELWDWEEGTDARLRHRPGPQGGEPLHAYAVAQFKDGGHTHIVLPWAKVMKTRDESQGWQSAVKFNKTDKSPWSTHVEAMAMKTAIRALSKYLPLSIEFQDAVQFDGDEATVDFASFATDPSAGPTIEGEVIEDDDGKEEEHAPEPESKTEPEKAQEKPGQKPEPEPEKSGTCKEYPVIEQIRNDLTDGAPIDATKQFHEEAIAALDEEGQKQLEALFAEFAEAA